MSMFEATPTKQRTTPANTHFRRDTWRHFNHDIRMALAFLLLAIPSPQPLFASENLRGLDHLDFREVVKAGKEKVFPAVVFIKVLREDMQRGEKQTQEISGSGVIISEKGEVLSNWHVVDKATEVRCH